MDENPRGLDGLRLDKHRIRRGFEGAAASFDGADVLQTEIRERLLERLQWLQLKPARILDLGAGTGRASAGLAARFPGAEIISLDVSPAMLARARASHPAAGVLAGDATRLPLVDGAVDLVFSSLCIHWCEPLDEVFAEVRRVLRFPGAFTFSTLGPDSFRELRSAFAASDDRPHVMGFPELRGLGDGLARAGLAEPVLDTDQLTLTYRDLAGVVADLRATGTTNADRNRGRGLLGPRAWARMAAAYETFRTPEGRLPVTVEVLCGQAWAPDPAGRRRQPPTEATIDPASIARRLRG
jgi:malonyl-CoA O-methyltransferase